MYVSLGNTPVTATASWVSQAKSAMEMQMTDGTTGPAVSATISTQSDVTAGRPVSSIGVPSRRNKSATSDRDSGIWSQTRTSLVDYSEFVRPGESEPGPSGSQLDDDEPIRSRLFDPDAKPITPRPADLVCVLAEDVGQASRGNVVYASPRTATPSVDDDVSENDRSSDDAEVIRTDPDHGTTGHSEAPVFRSVEELGEVITATALKHALASLSGLNIDEIETNPDLAKFFPKDKDHQQKLAQRAVTVNDKTKTLSDQQAKAEAEGQQDIKEQQQQFTSTPNGTDSLIALGKDERDSDDDSLLNSDDDYEEGLDDFFHKKKDKVLSLYTLKGVKKFKEFLKGTLGEKNWNLWLDIERAKLIKDEEEKHK